MTSCNMYIFNLSQKRCAENIRLQLRRSIGTAHRNNRLTSVGLWFVSVRVIRSLNTCMRLGEEIYEKKINSARSEKL